MGENIFDSFGNFLGISYTSNERKRDKYQSLYSSLNSKITKASDEIDKADGRFNRCCSYGNPETTGEPGTVYATAKQNLDDDYRTIKERLEQRLSEAQSAKSTAYQKYSHYKSMADAENPY